MWRYVRQVGHEASLSASMLWLVLVAAPALAEDDNPVFHGKPLSGWLDLLRGGTDQPGRLAAPHILGAPGGLAIVWAGPIDHRRAALIAVELIGPIRSSKVIPAAAAVLRNDPADRLREAAAQALGRMCAKARAENKKIDPGRDALVNALRMDRSGRVREAAATALGRLEIGALPALDALTAALGDPHTGTRTAAAEALRHLGKDARDAAPELQNLLRDRKANLLLRLQAAQTLGKIGGAESVPALIETLAGRDNPAEVRRAAAEALGSLADDASAATSALAATLTEPAAGTELRRAAAAALDHLGVAALPAVPALKKAVKDEDRFVRCLALHSLSRMGKELGPETSDVVTVLLQGLSDPVTEVRMAAVQALGTLGSTGLGADLPAVRQRLAESTRDGQKAVREAATDALKKLANP